MMNALTQLNTKYPNIMDDYDDKGNTINSNVCTNHNVPSNRQILDKGGRG
jgi:hypothetical protein